MKETVYVIGPSSIFNEEFALFQQGQGWYYEAGFKNWGAVRYSVDGTQVLLEETLDKFKPEHLELEDVTVFTEEEIQAYLIANSEVWTQPEEELI